MNMDILIIVLLVVVILLATFLLFKQNKSESGKDVETMMSEIQRHQAELHNQERTIMEEQHRRRIEELQKQYDKQFEQIQRETVAQFESLSAKLLKESSDGLKEVNREQIDSILAPLKENIENFRNMVSEVYKNDNASREALSSQIKHLMELNLAISEDAKNLTTALKGNSKVQGDWGEMILETLLENAGLEKGINYEVQLTRDATGTVIRDDKGKSLRPDVVVYMPDGHKMIIDSKVSLKAYVDYCSTDDAETKELFGRQHITSVKKHIEELSVKRYQDFVSGSADYVMMFIPNEGAYITAIQLEPDLWKYAYDRRVVMVSPTHLFSVMSIVCQLWQQDKQNKYALEIADRGGKLYDKAVLFVNEFEKIGESIKKLQTSYDTANSRLQERGSIISQAESLRRLGVKATKSMSQKMVDAVALEEELMIDDKES